MKYIENDEINFKRCTSPDKHRFYPGFSLFGPEWGHSFETAFIQIERRFRIQNDIFLVQLPGTV